MLVCGQPVEGRAAARPHLARRARCSGARCAAAATAEAASPVAAAAPPARRVVAVTGATGFVGSALVASLLADGATVRVLTRDASSARRKLPQTPPRGSLAFFEPAQWSEGCRGATAVVNLAGEPITTRWSESTKAAIMQSRVGATRRVVDAIRSLPTAERPRVLVSASAVGFYGASQTKRFDERNGVGYDYLAKVCSEWEAAASAVSSLGLRLVTLRLGVVLDRGGGALARMVPLFQLFVGGPPGDGKQWLSWVSREDTVRAFVRAIDDESLSGAYNVTAPQPVRMAELCSELGAATGRPSWLPVPEVAVSLLLGEGAMVVLQGQHATPARLTQAGFDFKYPTVANALRSIIKRGGI